MKSKAVVGLLNAAYSARDESADLLLVLTSASPLLHGGLQGKSQNAAVATTKLCRIQPGAFPKSVNRELW